MTKPSRVEKEQEQRYSGEVLAKSKLFSDVQKDFLRVILGNDFYTIEEAKDKLSKFLERS